MSLKEFYYYIFEEREFKGSFFLNPLLTFLRIFMIILFMVILFKPLYTEAIEIPVTLKTLFVFGYGFYGSLGYLIVMLLGVFFKNKTTIFYNFLITSLCIFVIWIIFYLYTKWCFTILEILFNLKINQEGLFGESFMAIIPSGFLISFILIKFDKIEHYRYKKKKINYQHRKRKYTLANNSMLVLKGKNKNEFVEMNVDDFIYITSEGHYIIVYFLNEKKTLKTAVLRNSMIEVEKQVKGFSSIYRCHRSHIINSKHLRTVVGNSNKSHLYLDKIPQKIALSKNKFSFFKELASKMNS